MAVTSVAADDLRNSYIPCIGGRPLSGFTKPLARLIDQFERLPGIGPRTAQRLALHLLNQPQEQIHQFADALLAARTQVGQCQTCFHQVWHWPTWVRAASKASAN